jgi:hypothetical protein
VEINQLPSWRGNLAITGAFSRCKRVDCKTEEEKTMGRGLLLWLIGIPLPIILLIWLFGGLH